MIPCREKVMRIQFWHHILDLLMRYPELIIALAWLIGILVAIFAGTATLAWYLREQWERNQRGALETLVEVGNQQLADTNQRLAEAKQEVAVAQQQLQSREANEAIGTTISAALLSLQNATASNTAAQNIFAMFPIITPPRSGGR
jgi:hypothetical protein